MADEALAVFHEPAASRRSNRRRALVVCLAAIVALACVAVAGQVATPAAMQTDFAQKNLAPCAAHPFGTDWMGRDMLMRTLAGLSTSVLIGCVAAFGVFAHRARVGGDGGAWRTEGRCGDHLVGGFGHGRSPHRFAHSHLLRIGQRFWGVTIGVALTHWPSLTRVVRAEVLQCKSRVCGCGAQLGVSGFEIAVKHMLPCASPVHRRIGADVSPCHPARGGGDVSRFRLPPEMPAVGIILSESMSYLTAGMWWLAVFPGVALVLTVMLFDAAGGNLRKLVDPHSAQE